MNRVDRALDFGCGPSPVLKVLLNSLGISADVYDPFFFPDKVFLNKRYQLITCTEVFEHLKNPLETIALLGSLLDDNGVLAVKTLFHTTCNDFNKWWYRHDPTHICFYSPRTFEWIGNKFDLNIKKIDNHSICVFGKTW
ncbi:MAG: class I SAM-dependent methyltransferase [Bacillota bacterium]